MPWNSALKLMLLASICTLSSCGGDDYTKNQDQGTSPAGNSTPKDADAAGTTETSADGNDHEQESGSTTSDYENADTTNDESTPPTSTTGTTTSGITIQDILAGIFGGGNGGNTNNTGGNTGGSSGGSTGQGGTSGNAPTPVQPAPEPTADDCIGADEFICAIEVAITYHTNLLRNGSDLTHHARLSYVSRDWSRQQMQRGSIGHQGFPAARRNYYNASFPGDSVSIQAENVAYSSGRANATAEDIAKMFVRMWANSPGHRRNMLGNYKILGVGVTKSGSRYYATQIFGAE